MPRLPPAITLWLTLCLTGHALAEEKPVSFIHDIMPRLMKAGCAGGNCHAKPEGQNNFKLSVFGYDPAHDYHEIVRDARGRRVFMAAPEESLLLRKATGQMPHEGGARIEKGGPAWNLLVTWIKQGAPFALEGEPALSRVTVQPQEGTYAKGAAQQLTVTASYSDGTTRDVTSLTDYLSQDKELAEVDDHGLVKTGAISGEGVIVARFMGHVDVARFTLPSDKKLPAEIYAKLPVNNEIDRLVHTRHQKLGLLPSGLCTDEEFLRRASLDLIGKLPSSELARRYLAVAGARAQQRPAATSPTPAPASAPASWTSCSKTPTTPTTGPSNGATSSAPTPPASASNPSICSIHGCAKASAKTSPTTA